MGTFSYEAETAVLVDIEKQVDIFVFAGIDVSTDIDDLSAVAEAFADAQGAQDAFTQTDTFAQVDAGALLSQSGSLSFAAISDPSGDDNGGGEDPDDEFEFPDAAISNVVAYLDCDGNGCAETKVKLDEWSDLGFEVHTLELEDMEAWLASVGYDDCELLALTVKAGANHDPAFTPGEGELVFGEMEDICEGVAQENVPEDQTFDMTDEIYDEFFDAMG